MISREKAANLESFAKECEIAYVFDHMGEINYGIRISVKEPCGKVEIHGAAFAVPGERIYNQGAIAQGIVNLWSQLGAAGKIGPKPQTDGEAVTLTGEPLQDLIQLGAAIHGIPTHN